FKDLYGIRVLNLSLGTNSTQSYRYSPLNYAVERAWDSGIVVVVSASNAGPAAKTIAKPGDDPLVITVGAVDDRGTAPRNDDMMAGFSGAGPTAADGLLKPDIVASGRSVVSLRATGSSIDTAYPGSRIGTSYFRGSGTSFSTAITAGTAALLLQKEPALKPNQVKHRVISKAAPGPVGNRNVDGYGSLDAYAAATAGTLTEANQGVARSYGTGKMGDGRGLLKLSILVPKEDCGGLLGCLLYGVLDVLTGLVRILLSGEKTAKNKDFDSSQYRGTWDGARWYTSQWSGARWYNTEWEGARWYGARWYSTDWYGARWYAIAWE
ncbi:MAG: S8 family serine peptidase, partial [Acidimicrobiia bacterium]